MLAEQEGTDCKSCCKTGTANPMYGKFGTLHPHFGKHHSDQTKKNIADHQPDKTGKNGSMYGKCSYDVWLKNHGKEFADKKLQEWKNKLSVAQSGSNNFWYGKKHSEESKIKIGNAHRGKIMSSESKRKMRVSAINRISQQKFNGGQIRPSFNPKSCKIIDEYGKQNGYKFQHAMNGGEFFIKELGYWVDGYDKEKNVVFEYDEEHHNWKKQKDDFRMNEIKNHLKCKFIRLNEKTGKIKKY
ncbi:MAG: NUMOD3 domain-containing DNA-binding protein [Candidatus Magasanikbacteria bacterium]|nr:NUMOD3 domain-containing DNA-binding protein [Candidatus Magasanikbacteria bacterium]